MIASPGSSPLHLSTGAHDGAPEDREGGRLARHRRERRRRRAPRRSSSRRSWNDGARPRNGGAARSTASSPAIQDAFVAVFPPPPVNGLGQVGGFKLELEDRAGLGEAALNDATQALIGQGVSDARSSPASSPSYRINVPQLEVEVDREKVKQEGISLTDLFQTMQVYLGSVYANDFNRFGRTYQVKVQADAPYRATAEQHRAAQGAERAGRDGAARLGGPGEAVARARPGAALQRVSRGRHQRRPGARLQLGPGGGRHRAAGAARCCRTASATSGPTSATSSGCPATRRSSSSRSACCSCSWCSRRSTRAGRCRSRSS